MKKKIFAVSTAALTAMALIPSAISYATEGYVEVTFNISSDESLAGWSYYDFNRAEGDATITSLGATGNTATLTLDVPVGNLGDSAASYGLILLEGDSWGGTQTENIYITGVDGATDSDTITVAITLTAADGSVSSTATLNAGAAAPSGGETSDDTNDDDTTTDDGETNDGANDGAASAPTITGDKDVADTGVAGVAAVVGVVAVAAGAMIVAKKRK